MPRRDVWLDVVAAAENADRFGKIDAPDLLHESRTSPFLPQPKQWNRSTPSWPMKIVNDGVSSAWKGQHVSNSCPFRVSLQPYCAAVEDRDTSRRRRSTQ